MSTGVSIFIMPLDKMSSAEYLKQLQITWFIKHMRLLVTSIKISLPSF